MIKIYVMKKLYFFVIKKHSTQKHTVFYGAEDGTRTHDLLITNQLLYQLSHSSIFKSNIIIAVLLDLVKN